MVRDEEWAGGGDGGCRVGRGGEGGQAERKEGRTEEIHQGRIMRAHNQLRCVSVRVTVWVFFFGFFCRNDRVTDVVLASIGRYPAFKKPFLLVKPLARRSELAGTCACVRVCVVQCERYNSSADCRPPGAPFCVFAR